jgi:hypothetical protein
MPTPPNPTLVIGLGGTGQLVACQVLKDIMELYDLHEVSLPATVQILAIDTDFANTAKLDVVGRGGRPGQVMLPDNMRIAIGDNIRPYALETQAGKHPETAAWMDAGWFMALPGNDTLLNLNHGAGQFRPLGRVAIPYNLTVRGGFLKTRIKSAIDSIKNQYSNINDFKGLNVCIAGSLCGGTGAGLAVDIAYLVKQLAGVTVNMVCYMVLPQAFDSTVNADDNNRRAFQRRAFAAMREMRRFARVVKYQSGIPMYYDNSDKEGDAILRGKLRETLFNLLYYFDGTMTRAVPDRNGIANKPVEVKDGVVPLIAEAVLMWVDGETANEISTHIANLNAQYKNLITEKTLPENAAVAGAFGAYSLQLPIYHIVEGWTYELARRALRDFVGVIPADPGGSITVPAPGESTIGKIATELRDDWRGGKKSKSGAVAAAEDWNSGTVAGVALNGLLMDELITGKVEVSGGTSRDTQNTKLKGRILKDWEDLLNGNKNFDEDDNTLRTEFLFPAEMVTQKGNLFGGNKKTRHAAVGESTGSSRKNPVQAAKDLQSSIDSFQDQHLGSINSINGCRGGEDGFTSDGDYPDLLAKISVQHVEKFKMMMQAWVNEVLNQDTDRPHAGKVGYLVSLVGQLEQMLDKAVARLKDIEKEKLGSVASARSSADVSKAYASMEKNVNKQIDYLKVQQDILEKERLYQAVRAARRVAMQNHQLVKQTRQSVAQWRTILAETLYSTLWKGYEDVQSQRNGLKHQEAVRKIIEDPVLEQERYKFYSGNNAKIDEVLEDFQWAIAETTAFVDGREYPALQLKLTLAKSDMPVGNPNLLANAFLERCRDVFQRAWEEETALKWLMNIYNDAKPDQNVDSLAVLLTSHGAPLLRTKKETPYKVGYIRCMYNQGSGEEGWVDNLKDKMVAHVSTDPLRSRKIESTDPYRVTFLGFYELNDVENVTAYEEGLKGLNGAGGYLSLPAQTPPTGGLSRQILHIFPAEHRACAYEARMAKLMPDLIVSLLEYEDGLRQFLLAWAYGSNAPAGKAPVDTLVNEYQFPADHPTHARKYVWRMSTGPFKEDIDPYTHMAIPAKHYWLTEPSNTPTALVDAAHGYLLDGVDRHQNPAADPTEVDYSRVWKEIKRQQEALTADFDVNKPVDADAPDFKDMLNRLRNMGVCPEADRAKAIMSQYQQLQGVNRKLATVTYPQPVHPIDNSLFELAKYILSDEMNILVSDFNKLNK